MGVRNLWTLLSPIGVKVPLYDLSGTTVAIDLSCWICESETSFGNHVQRAYLRNLFFRASKLLQLGVTPLFVLEGKAPELKQGEINRRLNKEVIESDKSKGRSRARLTGIMNECKKLLSGLGIPYIQSPGEAEAFCAWLNKIGVVDSCITQDSDAFLYGAQVVLRDFTINSKDAHVTKYTYCDIESKLNLNRSSLIALAIIQGCDYLPKGIPGVGKETALALIKELKNPAPFERFNKWTTDTQFKELYYLKLDLPPHCSGCHHEGSKRQHNISGCNSCRQQKGCIPDSATACKCKFHSKLRSSDYCELELGIYEKAMKNPDFPHTDVVMEYLSPDKYKWSENITIAWRKPCIKTVLNQATAKMNWEEDYVVQKVFPLITLWKLTYPSQQGEPRATQIIKSCLRNGVKCYQTSWEWSEWQCKELITFEAAYLLEKVYPTLIISYESSKKTKKVKQQALSRKATKNTHSHPPADEEDLERVISQITGLKLEPVKQHNAPCAQATYIFDYFKPIGLNVTTEKSSGQPKIPEAEAICLAKGQENNSSPKRQTVVPPTCSPISLPKPILTSPNTSTDIEDVCSPLPLSQRVMQKYGIRI